jgi:hypothetical protein
LNEGEVLKSKVFALLLALFLAAGAGYFFRYHRGLCPYEMPGDGQSFPLRGMSIVKIKLKKETGDNDSGNVKPAISGNNLEFDVSDHSSVVRYKAACEYGYSYDESEVIGVDIPVDAAKCFFLKEFFGIRTYCTTSL